MKHLWVSGLVAVSLACSGVYATDSVETKEKKTHQHSYKKKKNKKGHQGKHQHNHKHTSNKPYEGETAVEERIEKETELTNR